MITADAGPELRRRREALGQTRRSLAERWGIDPSTLHRWEMGGMGIGQPGMVEDALAHLELLAGIGRLPPPAGKAAVRPTARTRRSPAKAGRAG